LRWLVRSRLGPVPVAVDPNGRWVLYYTQAAHAHAYCRGNGFSEPVLWAVGVSGGRQRAGINTTSLAFSPDRGMYAYISAKHCGRTLRLVVVNRQSGEKRRIFLTHNTALSMQPTFTAQLSWAPDDVHLAVAMAPTPVINGLAVINAWHAANVATAPAMPPCAGDYLGCLDPVFDAGGRLTFLKWREDPAGASFAEWAIRWHEGRATRLFQLSRTQTSGVLPPALAVNRTGSAILLENYLRYPTIWYWSNGSMRLVMRSSQQLVAADPLWVPRR